MVELIFKKKIYFRGKRKRATARVFLFRKEIYY
jgi:ribosomal protein S9